MQRSGLPQGPPRIKAEPSHTQERWLPPRETQARSPPLATPASKQATAGVPLQPQGSRRRAASRPVAT